MGILADRFGGRLVFAFLMSAVAVPAFLVPQARSFETLLIVAFFLGLAGSSFAVGVSYVSALVSARAPRGSVGRIWLGKHGTICGRISGAPARKADRHPRSLPGHGRPSSGLGIAFGLLARDAPAKAAPKGLGATLAILTNERVAWVLSAFYFLTFGGFVAFSIYLPTLLRDQFGLSTADAGFRTAGFVVLATLLRPVGGWLSDKIGGARVLSAVFLGIVPFALLLSWSEMVPFTVGALGCAALMGLGNGGVFKLVPQYFPASTGTVTGLVGAMGGMGGFFPPLLLGFFRDRMGAVWPGFLCLSAMALALWWLNRRIFIPRQEALELALPPELNRTADRLRAGSWATLWTGFLIASIVVGSRTLQNFDAALVIYTFAVIFAHFGVVYHYCVWLQKPPTQMFWRRGWQIFFRRGVFSSLRRLIPVAITASCCPALHQQAVPAALVDAPVAVLGMPARCSHHFSPGLWMDSLRDSPRGPVDLCRPRFRVSSVHLSIAHAVCLDTISRVGYCSRDGVGGHRVVSVAADERFGRTVSANLRHGLSPAHSTVRDISNRSGFDRLNPVDAWWVLSIPFHFARHHCNSGTAVSAVRQVLPHLSKASAIGRETLPVGW